MRGIEKFVTAIFWGLVAFGVWNVRDLLSQYLPVGTPAPSIAPRFPPETTKVVVPKGTAQMRSRERPLGAGDVTVLEVPYKAQPFPEPKDLISGLTGAQIRSVYGDPATRITVSQGGQLVEKYYYLSKDHTRYTVASLQDGRLISASSMPL